MIPRSTRILLETAVLWLAASILNASSSFGLLSSTRARSILRRRPDAVSAATSLTAASVNDDDESDIQTITLPSFAADDNNNANYPSKLHHLHVCGMLTDDQVAEALRISRDYAAGTSSWNSPDSDRHASYATCDFPVDECEALQAYLEEIDFDGALFGRFAELYDVGVEDLSYLDLFVAHYQAKEDDNNPQAMDRLEAHRDGSLLAFSLLLSPPDGFEGGGTFYEALRDAEPHRAALQEGGVVRPTRAGDAVLHCGKILHGADVVTAGSRTVLVGFVDVSPRCQRPGVLGEACKQWGRMDVAQYRYRRQLSRGGRGSWRSANARFLQGDGSCSAIKGVAVASEGVVRRADPEYSRKKRLEAEDVLLRSVLLPQEERSGDVFGGDISILDFEEDLES